LSAVLRDGKGQRGCLHDWERIFEEGVESMNEQVVRKWVEDLRPRAGGVTEVLATVMEED
jgi:hypothetical protein